MKWFCEATGGRSIRLARQQSAMVPLHGSAGKPGVVQGRGGHGAVRWARMTMEVSVAEWGPRGERAFVGCSLVGVTLTI